MISCSYLQSTYFWLGGGDQCGLSRRKITFTLIINKIFIWLQTPNFGYKMIQHPPKMSTSSNILRIDIVISHYLG